MDTQAIIGIVVRLLPAIIVFVLGFIAAADRKTRERWGNLLYQVGSIRPDQREDPKVGSGVKLPFFIVAFFLLLWPLQYYRHYTRTLIGTESADLFQQKEQPQSDLTSGNNNKTTPSGASNAVSTPSTQSTPASDLHNASPAVPSSSATPQSDLH
jgi:hypothetical protein